MTKRRLSQEEKDLWKQVAERTEQLHPEAGKLVFPPPKSVSVPDVKSAVSINPFELGQKTASKTSQHNLVPSLSATLGASPVQMDRKAFTKMKRGKLGPEARIDLHGMTLDRAHPALSRFILSAHGSGKRLVLVITGKGRAGRDEGPIPVRHGVLKHQVPQWLAMPPLSNVVLQVSQAHISHGGSGAYYVYLRRPR